MSCISTVWNRGFARACISAAKSAMLMAGLAVSIFNGRGRAGMWRAWRWESQIIKMCKIILRVDYSYLVNYLMGKMLFLSRHDRMLILLQAQRMI